jgi:hypothetical protein
MRFYALTYLEVIETLHNAYVTMQPKNPKFDMLHERNNDWTIHAWIEMNNKNHGNIYSFISKSLWRFRSLQNRNEWTVRHKTKHSVKQWLSVLQLHSHSCWWRLTFCQNTQHLIHKTPTLARTFTKPGQRETDEPAAYQLLGVLRCRSSTWSPLGAWQAYPPLPPLLLCPLLSQGNVSVWLLSAIGEENIVGENTTLSSAEVRRSK